jgi:hypothetical protein
MLDNFVKSLGFIGVDAINMKFKPSDKYMFDFEDENIDKHWRCFYAFYKLGYNDCANKIGAFAIQEIRK